MNRSDAREAATGISFFGVVGGAAIPSGVIVYGVWQRRRRRRKPGDACRGKTPPDPASAQGKQPRKQRQSS